jgi:NTE family protein
MLKLGRTFKSFHFFPACVALLFVLSACQTVSRRGPGYPTPSTPSTADHKQEVLQPETASPPPVKFWQKLSGNKVAIVLGPGGAKTFAHVGVIKALVQNRIPVEKVIGLEWASIVGGLYASKGQIHEVEWKLYKMEQKDWLPRKGLFDSGSSGAAISSMNDFFKDSFGSEEIQNFKIPFACTSRSIWTATLVMRNRGAASEAMKHCVPFPPLFKVSGGFIGAPSHVKEAIRQLKAEGYNIVILIDVLGSAAPVAQDALLEQASHVILWQEIRRQWLEARELATDVIEIDTSAYPMSKFTARKELVELGESLAKTPVSAIVNKYNF